MFADVFFLYFCRNVWPLVGDRPRAPSPSSGWPARWNNAAAGDTSGGYHNMKI